jgi:hypothetical protein
MSIRGSNPFGTATVQKNRSEEQASRDLKEQVEEYKETTNNRTLAEKKLIKSIRDNQSIKDQKNEKEAEERKAQREADFAQYIKNQSILNRIASSVKNVVGSSTKTATNVGGGSQSKEILGKQRRIYKVAGSRKEHIKYKGQLIPVSDYKKLFKK